MVFSRRSSIRKSMKMVTSSMASKNRPNKSMSLCDLNNTSITLQYSTKTLNTQSSDTCRSSNSSPWRRSVSRSCIKKIKSIKKSMKKLRRSSTGSQFLTPILSTKESCATTSSSSIIIWEECFYETLKRKKNVSN